MGDRREQPERRKNTERRKASDARQVAIEVCSSDLRMALIHRATGKTPDTVVTRSQTWRKEATTLHSAEGTRELLDAFRQLVAEEKLTGSRIRITLSGAYCVTRVLAGTADDVRREFSQLEDRSQLYLSLGPGRKALAGSVQPIDARHQHALLTVSNQKTLDVLVHIADTVGVTIESIEPSLVSLSRIVHRLSGSSDEPYLIVHLDDEAAELGICHQGMLLLDYRPGGINSTEEVAQVVAQHVGRLQRYCGRHFRFVDGNVHRAMLCGNQDLVAQATAAFEAQPDLDIEILDPKRIDAKWKFIGDPPESDLAAALGTALTLSRNETDMSSPNLMEDLLAQSREPMRPFFAKSLLPLAATLAVAAAVFWLNLRQAKTVDEMRQQAAELAPASAQAREYRLTLAKTERLLNNLSRLDTNLQQTAWSEVVATIGRCIPDDVWLDRLTVDNDGAVALAGESFADTGIYEFVRWLDKAPGLNQVALRGTRETQTVSGPTTNFDIEMLLVSQGVFDGAAEEQ